jgi:hypothetical protein
MFLQTEKFIAATHDTATVNCDLLSIISCVPLCSTKAVAMSTDRLEAAQTIWQREQQRSSDVRALLLAVFDAAPSNLPMETRAAIFAAADDTTASVLATAAALSDQDVIAEGRTIGRWAAGLPARATDITVITMEPHHFTAALLRATLPALREAPRLEHVVLADCDVTTQLLGDLCCALRPGVHTVLRAIDVSRNPRIAAQGGKELLRLVAALPSLRQVDTDDTGVMPATRDKIDMLLAARQLTDRETT